MKCYFLGVDGSCMKVWKNPDASLQYTLYLGYQYAVVGHGNACALGHLSAISHLARVEHTAAAVNDKFIFRKV